MKPEFFQFMMWVGLGACFIAGCWIVGLVITALCSAFCLEQKVNQLEKLFRDTCHSNWEIECHYKELKAQYPLKEKKK